MLMNLISVHALSVDHSVLLQQHVTLSTLGMTTATTSICLDNCNILCDRGKYHRYVSHPLLEKLWRTYWSDGEKENVSFRGFKKHIIINK
jgi:hypothetical protein